MVKKKIILTIEESDVFSGRYDIISQVPGFPKWLTILDGEDATFSSKSEALKFLPQVKKEIQDSNPDAEVIFKK